MADIWNEFRQKHDLKLLEAKTFKNGVVMIRYQALKK
jgi:hypothetical protein